jgi:trk system potassium uptake protein TrkH
VLILAGAFLIFAFEYSNLDTIGELSFGNKVMASLFESVTLRSAGFKTFPQECMTEASMVLALIYMFIGGSPLGTAGGVKTITVVLLVLSMLAAVKGIDEVRAFHRKISDNYVRRAVAVVVVFFLVLMAFIMILSVTEEADFVDILFESVGAATTAGISRGITGDLSTAGKWIVMLAMYLGRLGPITMALAFNAKTYEGKKSYAEGKVIIG